jgi:lysophospholipase L1-like esterase
MKKALLFLVVFFLGTSIAQSQLVDQKIMRDTLNARMARDTVKDIGKIATQYQLNVQRLIVDSIFQSQNIQYFRPDQLPNLRLWLDAADPLTLFKDSAKTAPVVKDADNIGCWLDKSGNYNDATQTIVELQPILKSGIINGHSIIRFNNSQLITPSFLSSAFDQAFTWYAVVLTQPSGLKIYASNGMTWYSARDHDYIYDHLGYLSPVLISKLYPAISAGTLATAIVIDSYSYDGTNATFGMNGIYHVVSTTGNMGLSGALTIGDLTGGGFAFPGDIAELILYNSAQTQAQMLQVYQYLSKKYAININQRHWTFQGDSRTYGTHATTGNSYPEQLMRLDNNNSMALAINLGGEGKFVSQMIASAADFEDYFPLNGAKQNVVVLWGGINDAMNDAKNAADIYALINTYCTGRRAAGYNKILVCTEIDAQCFAANAVGWHTTIQPALNALLRANHAFCDGLIDLGADTRLQDATNTTCFNSDKLHLNDNGYSVVAGLVRDAIILIQ